jgi:dienelactone hydrolase
MFGLANDRSRMEEMHKVFTIALCTTLAMLSTQAPAISASSDPEKTPGLAKDVVFADYSPLSANTEIIRRMLSPLAAAQIPTALARAGRRLSVQPVNLSAEKFVLYVPQREPSQGFGLLVFVPPWNAAVMPSDWPPVLDQSGLIFVSPTRSGNDASVLGRRYPLALLAEYNVAKRYRVDSQRIYIAGFSGGSRVALRLALAYPDVFRGAILDAGSDPVGDSSTPLPPRELLFKAQETMHLVYVTGDQDTERDMHNWASMHSLKDWCIFNVDSYAEPFVAHDVMNASALARALNLLATPGQENEQDLAGCRSRIERELDAQLGDVQSLARAGKRDEARQKLLDMDSHFGGLGAPQSVELFNRLETT